MSLDAYRKKGKKPSWLSSGQTQTNDKEEKSIVYESSSDEEYSYFDDTSLSISKHVPCDVGEDGVDDIVAQAEAYLEHSHEKLSKNLGGGDHAEQDFSVPPLPEKNRSHKYLSANEVITYEPDMISLQSEDSEHSNKETSDETRDCDLVDKSKCWCNNLRSLDIKVPEEVDDNWLSSLSLATVHENVKETINSLIEHLQEKISIHDPQEEFKQLRNVPITDECETANLQKNRSKNRFRNVLPCKLTHAFSFSETNWSV